MSIDVLKEFFRLRNQLAEEKSRLEARLAQIKRVLGVEASPATEKNSAAKSNRTGPAGGHGRIKNPMSLRAAIVKVSEGKPLTKKQILEAVQRLGYQFGTDRPILSINPILYGKNPRFKRNGGKFSPAK